METEEYEPKVTSIPKLDEIMVRTKKINSAIVELETRINNIVTKLAGLSIEVTIESETNKSPKYLNQSNFYSDMHFGLDIMESCIQHINKDLNRL